LRCWNGITVLIDPLSGLAAQRLQHRIVDADDEGVLVFGDRLPTDRGNSAAADRASDMFLLP